MMQGFLKLTEASGAQLWVLLVAIFFRQVSVTLLDPQWASHQKNIHLIVNCSLMTLTDYLQVGRLKWKVGIFVIQSLAIVPARICNFIGIKFSLLLFLEKISFFFFDSKWTTKYLWEVWRHEWIVDIIEIKNQMPLSLTFLLTHV